MARNVYHPTTDRNVSSNRAQIKATHQKPESFRWMTPDCDEGEGDDLCTGDEPLLDNGFAQPSGASGLERFAFRLNADGRIQTKGFLDVSGASSGTVAWVMPGIAAGELNYMPPVVASDGFSLRVSTTGDMSGATNATAHIDSTTGDVTITWSSGGGAVWAALSTANIGWEYQGAGASDEVDWYQAWLSDSAGAFFELEVVTGGGQYGDDICFLLMKQSGLYTFTTQFLTSDLDGAANPGFDYQFRLNVCGGTPGTTQGGGSDRYPGQLGSPAFLQNREQHYISSNSGDDMWLPRSWTLPVRHPNPGTTRRCGEIRVAHDPQLSGDIWWSVRLWIVRWSDFDWDQSNDFASSEAYWNTGDADPD